MKARGELPAVLLVIALSLSGGCFLRPATYPTSQYQPIHKAALAGDTTKISELLQGDPKSVNLHGWGGDTPLHLAVIHHHLAAVQLLLEKGALVDAHDDQGGTPLHLTAQFGFIDVADVLLTHGAKVNLRGTDGHTPLARAELHHRAAMVDWLKQHDGQE
jgi:ankyrin repeat protein